MDNASGTPTVLIVLICTLAIVGLLAYARGPEHHRGDEIGTHGTRIIVVQPAQ